MYIGPWQEYNLSKSRRPQPQLPSVAVKRDLEAAIARSLDPAAAQAAIAAVETFFNAQASQVPEQAPSIQPQRPSHRPGPNRGRPRPKRLPTLTSRNLVEMELSMNSARELTISDSASSISTPLSVRSSQSEPTPSMVGSRLPPLSTSAPSAAERPKGSSFNRSPGAPQKLPIVSTQSPREALHAHSPAKPSLEPIDISHRPSDLNKSYNASAVVALLRLERAQKKRAALEKVMGWKVQADQTASSDDETAVKRRADPAERDKERRIEHVQTMRRTYLPPTSLLPLTGALVFTDSPTASTNTLPPFEEPPPSTPQIKDLALTDQELGLVSKYFQQGHVPSQVRPPLSGGASVGLSLGIASQSLSVTPPPRSRPTSQTDELFVGSPDGLLKWSAQLDLDSF